MIWFRQDYNMDKLNLNKLRKPFLISGPCVMENLETSLYIADFLKQSAQKYDIDIIFKASFDKANRSSAGSFRGPGLKDGLKILEAVRRNSLYTTTDIHETHQIGPIADTVDILQIPAFLCRQTDLLLNCAKTGKIVNIKKGQFLSPWDTKNISEKIRSVSDSDFILTERGTSFGYNNLIVDFRSFSIMKEYAPYVCFDITHSIQRPGGLGNQSTGDKEFVFDLTKAALALDSIDCLFFEIHPEPQKALSDGPNSLNFTEFSNILEYMANVRNFRNEINK